MFAAVSRIGQSLRVSNRLEFEIAFAYPPEREGRVIELFALVRSGARLEKGILVERGEAAA